MHMNINRILTGMHMNINRILTGTRKVFVIKSMNFLASFIVDMYPNDILTDPVGCPSTMSRASPHT